MVSRYLPMPIDDMSASDIMNDAVFEAVLDEDDVIVRQDTIFALTQRCRDLKTTGLLRGWQQKLRAFMDADKAQKKEEKENNTTDFRYNADLGIDTELRCGAWVADQNGIRTLDMFGWHEACPHPILITKLYENAETGREKVRIAFKKRQWKEIVVDKGVIASASRITGLADMGVNVTSENAKLLVRFLSDIEKLNQDRIEQKVSTSRLGWVRGEFMPYNHDIEFDADTRFKTAFESVHEQGSSDEWYRLAKEIRKAGRRETQLYLAGSLASALVEPMSLLPFIINLWGGTGKGKTVALMYACSVWADPSDSRYITDPKSTVNALELQMDFRNSFPMLIDDMAQIKNRYDGDFSELVYMLCSGKGKDRANRDLGINRSSTWHNAILTNGEHSLITDTMQGGAINRVIDMEIDETAIFQDGNRTSRTLADNFGFCGHDFIEAVNRIGFDEIRRMYDGFRQQLVELQKENEAEKEEKQILPMALLLTADKIATDELFHDGIYMNVEFYFDILKDKQSVSEGDRAYQFIMDMVQVHIAQFKPGYQTVDGDNVYRGDIWGDIKDGYVNIIPAVFNQRFCVPGNFNRAAFCSWAKRNELLKHDRGKNTRKYRLGNEVGRQMVSIKLPSDDDFGVIEDENQLPF